MSRTKKNAQVEQVNEVKNAAMQVENTNTSADNGQCVQRDADNKDAQKVYDLLMKALRSEYAEIDSLQGQRGLAVKAARELGYDDLAKTLNSKDCLVGLKRKFNHLCFAKIGKDGEQVEEYVVLVKYVSLAKYIASHENGYADYNAQSVIDLLGDKSLKANKFALVGYQHDGEYVATTSFAELRHEYKHEETRMVESFDKKGKSLGLVPDKDDEGKVIKDIITETYVPVISKGNKVQRKAFMKALGEWLQENAFSVLLAAAKK